MDEDRIVIITGASSGIGKATAKALARKGFTTVLAARNLENLQKVEKEITSEGGNAFSISTDITVRCQVKDLVDSTLKHFGKIDIFICNAGIYWRCPAKDLPMEDIQHVMNTNFYGSLFCIYEVLPHMLSRKNGQIIVVSSFDGLKGIPPDSAYVASKSAVTGFAEVMRQELNKYGITVTTIFPSRVNTPMTANIEVPFISRKVPPEYVAKRIIKSIYKRKKNILVPYLGPKLLYVTNCISPNLGDFLVKLFRLEGKDIKK